MHNLKYMYLISNSHIVSDKLSDLACIKLKVTYFPRHKKRGYVKNNQEERDRFVLKYPRNCLQNKTKKTLVLLFLWTTYLSNSGSSVQHSLSTFTTGGTVITASGSSPSSSSSSSSDWKNLTPARCEKRSAIRMQSDQNVLKM